MNRELELKIQEYRRRFPQAPVFFFNLYGESIPIEVKLRLIDQALESGRPLISGERHPLHQAFAR